MAWTFISAFARVIVGLLIFFAITMVHHQFVKWWFSVWVVVPEESSPEQNDDVIAAKRIALELDDLAYELDSDGDSQVPQLLIPRDKEGEYVRLPDKEGEFEVITRSLVEESRRNASTYKAAKYAKFVLYTHSNNRQPVEFSLDDVAALPERFGFKVGIPTTVLIHGWLGNSQSEAIGPLAKEFLDTGDFNVIAVDWEQGAKTLLYSVARYRVPVVAELIAGMIDGLMDIGQTPDQIGIVGHSLGAHIAGIAGKRMAKKIAFVIGLDPASPLFRFNKLDDRLAEGDAKYVEVIHTNAKALGFYRNIALVDFYPNGGSFQPGCGLSLVCSHTRAVLYFKESLHVKNYFGRRCSDIEGLSQTCSLDKALLGGYDMKTFETKPKGVYYLSTAPNTPFLRSV